MSLKFPIYLDNNATTRLDPRVLEVMNRYFLEDYGNSASRNHEFGWHAEDGVTKAREQVGDLIGASGKEIIWTSGSTESNNLAIKGVAEMYGKKGGHIITALDEHKAVIDPCRRLQKNGFDVTWLEPDSAGVVSVEKIEAAMRDDTILVSIMWANNEVGVINPIAEIGKLCKSRGVIFHTDATQAVGKIEIDVEAAGVDLLSASAHKLYGPKGVGCLYVRRRRPRVRLTAIIDGGGHERGMRSGTINVPGVAGMGEACEIAGKEMTSEAERLGRMRDRLEVGITEGMEGTKINGVEAARLPHTTNVSFAWVEGESLMMAIKEIAVSSGSACTSASLEPSYVLKSLGIGDDLAHSSLRFGLGRFTTDEEIDYTIAKVKEGVNKLREMSPLYELAMEGVDLSTIDWGGH